VTIRNPSPSQGGKAAVCRLRKQVVSVNDGLPAKSAGLALLVELASRATDFSVGKARQSEHPSRATSPGMDQVGKRS